MRRQLVFAIAMSMVVLLGPLRLGVAAEGRAPQAPAQAPGQSQSQAMPDMMKMHEQMMGGRGMMMNR